MPYVTFGPMYFDHIKAGGIRQTGSQRQMSRNGEKGIYFHDHVDDMGDGCEVTALLHGNNATRNLAARSLSELKPLSKTEPLQLTTVEPFFSYPAVLEDFSISLDDRIRYDPTAVNGNSWFVCEMRFSRSKVIETSNTEDKDKGIDGVLKDIVDASPLGQAVKVGGQIAAALSQGF